MASGRGHREAVRALLRHGAAVDKCTNPADLPTCPERLVRGRDVSLLWAVLWQEVGDFPLRIASRDGYLEVVELLVASGATVNKDVRP
jgi:ankyrin repeat protein